MVDSETRYGDGGNRMTGVRFRAKDWPDKTLIVLWAIFLVVSTLTIPVILVKKIRPEPSAPAPLYEWPVTLQKSDPLLNIPVYLSNQQKVIEVPLELYVRGVVAAEMPPDFELEALKAQAIAARTYIIRKIVMQNFSDVPHPDAWVTDTVIDQAYLTEEQLRERWSQQEYKKNISRINRAVAETKGQMIVYEGHPIDATYFSTSNGYTENSEEYWTEAIPYLRSVASPWDAEISPKYKTVVEIPVKEVLKRLGLNDMPAADMAAADMPVTATAGHKPRMAVMEKTGSNRIKSIRINGAIFTGREVREKLELPSSQFTWQMKGDKIEFTTYGYGHGVGMSQYGAQGMALEGRTAHEILTYYYQGVRIVHMDEVIPL